MKSAASRPSVLWLKMPAGLSALLRVVPKEMESDIYSGEIYTLYVLKQFQRRGIGGKLVSALATRLNQDGIYSMLVRVLKLNPYRRFYQKINGTYIKAERLPFAEGNHGCGSLWLAGYDPHRPLNCLGFDQLSSASLIRLQPASDKESSNAP